MTVLGTVIAIEVPIASAGLLAVGGWYARRLLTRYDDRQQLVTDKLSEHDDALALVLAQVLPPNAPSLTETLHAIQTEQAVQSALAKAATKSSEDWRAGHAPPPATA